MRFHEDGKCPWCPECDEHVKNAQRGMIAAEQYHAVNQELRARIEELEQALRWCGDHGDNGCWQKANSLLGLENVRRFHA